MTHARQHSGWATAARRRGERIIGCTICGQVPKHPRPFLQAAPHRAPSRLSLAVGLIAQVAAALIVAVVAFAGMVGLLIGGPA